jgi:hypothetical protein
MIMSEYIERIKTEINQIGITNDTISGQGSLLFIIKDLLKNKSVIITFKYIFLFCLTVKIFFSIIKF